MKTLIALALIVAFASCNDATTTDEYVPRDLKPLVKDTSKIVNNKIAEL